MFQSQSPSVLRSPPRLNTSSLKLSARSAPPCAGPSGTKVDATGTRVHGHRQVRQQKKELGLAGRRPGCSGAENVCQGVGACRYPESCRGTGERVPEESGSGDARVEPSRRSGTPQANMPVPFRPKSDHRRHESRCRKDEQHDMPGISSGWFRPFDRNRHATASLDPASPAPPETAHHPQRL